MIPAVFISSTVSDLRHIRDTVRDTIKSLYLIPVMSDYGEIPYMGDAAAEEFCYQTVKDCQIMVLIIGKRYGTESREEPSISVTEKEFRTAQKTVHYLITFLDREVYEAKKIYDANVGMDVKFPGMDNPPKTFAFIDLVNDASANNGIITFSSASEVDVKLRKQLASLMGRLLQDKVTDNGLGVSDIISELKGLRAALNTSNEVSKKAREITKGVKFLFDDKNREFAGFLRKIGEIDSVILMAIKAPDFRSFLGNCKVQFEEHERLGIARVDGFAPIKPKEYVQLNTFVPFDEVFDVPGVKEFPVAEIGWLNGNKVMLNKKAFNYLSRRFQALKDNVMDALSEV